MDILNVIKTKWRALWKQDAMQPPLRLRILWAFNRWRYPDQAWFWTAGWQAGEAQASKDIAEGRYKEFDTLEDMIADMYSDSVLEMLANEDRSDV